MTNQIKKIPIPNRSFLKDNSSALFSEKERAIISLYRLRWDEETYNLSLLILMKYHSFEEIRYFINQGLLKQEKGNYHIANWIEDEVDEYIDKAIKYLDILIEQNGGFDADNPQHAECALFLLLMSIKQNTELLWCNKVHGYIHARQLIVRRLVENENSYIQYISRNFGKPKTTTKEVHEIFYFNKESINIDYYYVLTDISTLILFWDVRLIHQLLIGNNKLFLALIDYFKERAKAHQVSQLILQYDTLYPDLNHFLSKQAYLLSIVPPIPFEEEPANDLFRPKEFYDIRESMTFEITL